jgi:hypothetical protein
MPQAYPGAYGGGIIDFSPLRQIGEDIGGLIKGRREQNDLTSALEKSKNPDGTYDYNKAYGLVLSAGNIPAANSIARIAEAEGLSQYRERSLQLREEDSESPDMKLWREWNAANQGQAGSEPMRASPPQPSGVPGMSLQNAPAFIQDKFMSIDKKKRLESSGKAEGERDAQKATLTEIAPGFQKMIDQLVVNAQEADNETFQHALGPLQGAAEPETWQGAVTNFIPQTWGALENYYAQGKKEGFIGGEGANLHIKEPGELPGGYTSTLRSKINSTSASLINVLQRALRVPGIGAQSDKELQQIVNQVGELNKSRDKADFYERLSNVVSNFNNLGIPVEMPTAEELAGVKPSNAAVQNYTQPPQTQDAGTAPYDAAQEAPPPANRASATAIGGEPAIVGPGAAPPMVKTSDKNKLKFNFNKYRNDPAALGEMKRQFNAKYDPDGRYGLFDALLSEISSGGR